MGRHKKQPSLSALEHIPAVKEALRVVGLELIIRPLGVVAPVATMATKAPLATVAVAATSQEWAQQSADVQAAIDAELGVKTPKPIEKLPAAQRLAIQKGLLAEMEGRKAELMTKFKHDAPTNGVEAPSEVASEPIETLSEAT